MLDIDIAAERILKEYIDGPTIFELVKNDAMKDTYASATSSPRISHGSGGAMSSVCPFSEREFLLLTF